MNEQSGQTAPRHSVSVTGIVVAENQRVLAIKRPDDGTWVPPGGILELDEGPADGVIREVLEETGVHVEPLRLTGIYKNMRRGIVSLAFLCRPTAGEPRSTDEALNVAWLTLDTLAHDVVEARAIRVYDAFRDDGPFVRTHDGYNVMRDDKLSQLDHP